MLTKIELKKSWLSVSEIIRCKSDSALGMSDFKVIIKIPWWPCDVSSKVKIKIIKDESLVQKTLISDITKLKMCCDYKNQVQREAQMQNFTKAQ